MSDATAVPEVQGEGSLRGVRGWLLAFCVWLAILGPLRAVVDVADRPFQDLFSRSLELGLAVFSAWAGVALWRMRPSAMKLLRAYLLVNLGLAAVAFAVFAASHNPSVKADMFDAIYLAPFPALCWLYFRRSERVRATFGANLAGAPWQTVVVVTLGAIAFAFHWLVMILLRFA